MKLHSARLLLIALFFILAIGCKKDKGPQPIITLLAQSITSSETTTYSYDENNRVTGYVVENVVPSYNYTAAFTYNSSGQLTEVRYNPANSIEDTKDVYSYNASGQLSTIESYHVTNVYASMFAKYEADYSTAGKVRVYKFSSAGTGTAYLDTDYILDSKGNVVQQLSYNISGNVIVTTENSEFDNKKAAAASLPQTGFVKNVNNYGKVTVTATGGTPSVTTYSYEYEADGFPAKRTASTGSVIRYAYLKK